MCITAVHSNCADTLYYTIPDALSEQYDSQVTEPAAAATTTTTAKLWRFPAPGSSYSGWIQDTTATINSTTVHEA
jgi:hypothetical protein